MFNKLSGFIDKFDQLSQKALQLMPKNLLGKADTCDAKQNDELKPLLSARASCMFFTRYGACDCDSTNESLENGSTKSVAFQR